MTAFSPKLTKALAALMDEDVQKITAEWLGDDEVAAILAKKWATRRTRRRTCHRESFPLRYPPLYQYRATDV